MVLVVSAQKVGNILWTFLAPMLVKLENHRTQSEMEDLIPLSTSDPEVATAFTGPMPVCGSRHM